MQLKNIIVEDFSNYRTCAMFVAFPKCNWKCEREAGCKMCQNRGLALQPNIELSVEQILALYDNPLTSAMVLGGLEPFDSFSDVLELCSAFRERFTDPIVIYTGYEESELKRELGALQQVSNIIIKFGRFRPNCEKHFDKLLGVQLASPNQYAKRIS